MSLLHHRNNWITAVALGAMLMNNPALAARPVAGARSISSNGAGGSQDGPCAGLSGAAFGLCNAYCEAQDCDVNPDRHSCDVLRSNFEKETGSSTFPCDAGVVTPTSTTTHTATNTPEATATDTPEPTATDTPEVAATDTPTQTPTETGVPTGTVTATATPTDTAEPTATDTNTPEPTATDTPTSTPTETGVPTGTVTATATPTDTAEPTATDTNTPEATSTDTPTATPTDTLAVPTGTAEATATDTPEPTATDTPAPSTSTPTATPTPTETPLPCPMTPGVYTNTQTAGGELAVDGLTPFPFPSGGTIVQHISAATGPACIHDSVVPFPGGFSAPIFCIPGLNFSVQVTQDGCGVGRIDSNGGSDFTISELGDTSSPTVCGLPASNCLTPPGDSNVQVDITVGDGVADSCGSGTANAAVVVPVHTVTWSHSPVISCTGTAGGGPGPDTTGPGGTGDTTVVEFDQNLDFTTDSTFADWSDLDIDGCCLAGSGPSSPQPCAFGGGGPAGLGAAGTCIDLTGINVAGPDVTTVAAGPIGSNGAPLYDITFSTTLPNAVTGPAGAATATCAAAPVINFGGLAMRCIP